MSVESIVVNTYRSQMLRMLSRVVVEIGDPDSNLDEKLMKDGIFSLTHGGSLCRETEEGCVK